MGLSFFGLTPESAPGYREQVLEHVFLLMYYGGFSYSEARLLPITYRIWFIRRINDEFKKSNEKGQGASRGAHHNTPDVRQMQGRAREFVPAKLRRFT